MKPLIPSLFAVLFLTFNARAEMPHDPPLRSLIYHPFAVSDKPSEDASEGDARTLAEQQKVAVAILREITRTQDSLSSGLKEIEKLRQQQTEARNKPVSPGIQDVHDHLLKFQGGLVKPYRTALVLSIQASNVTVRTQVDNVRDPTLLQNLKKQVEAQLSVLTRTADRVDEEINAFYKENPELVTK